ncbi:hypothetical protein AB0911_31295 [Streptomyces nigra]|uniref:hypothetical protein n=1 Tax=Streptomyces nigra TaxID=1827580 RepID=UPI0034535319
MSDDTPNVRVRVHKSVELSADVLELLLEAALNGETAVVAQAHSMLRHHNGRFIVTHSTPPRSSEDAAEAYGAALAYLRTRLSIPQDAPLRLS